METETEKEIKKKRRIRYKLYADGTIIDQVTTKVAGYIHGSRLLNDVYMMRTFEQQKYLREFLG